MMLNLIRIWWRQANSDETHEIFMCIIGSWKMASFLAIEFNLGKYDFPRVIGHGSIMHITINVESWQMSGDLSGVEGLWLCCVVYRATSY